MKTKTYLLLTAAFLILGAITLVMISVSKPNPTTKQPKTKTSLAFRASIPYWDQDRAFNSFKENISKFNHVSLFWYYVDLDGSIKRYQYAKEDKSIIDFAHQNNVKVGALIANLVDDEDGEETWDSDRVEQVISTSEAREKHIAQITAKLEELNFDGVNIDYEQVDADQKQNFSLFIAELKEQLSKKGKFVGVALHPKTDVKKENEGIGAFQDWKEIGKHADQLYIMSYGEHYDDSSPGPIASEDWLKKIIFYAEEAQLPKNKIFLGTGLYGYSWPNDEDEEVISHTFTDIQAILQKNSLTPEWDENSKAPYFSYSENGEEYEAWFENAQSIDAKTRLASQNGLAGVSFWRLGGEDPQIWTTIRPSYK